MVSQGRNRSLSSDFRGCQQGIQATKSPNLSDQEKKLFARQVEVFAAYLDMADHETGRFIQAIKDMGELDNTQIIYIAGDNGTSAEGGMSGL